MNQKFLLIFQIIIMKKKIEYLFEKHDISRINPFINSKNVIKINKNKL